MGFILALISFGFVLSGGYIVLRNRDATSKRKAFRWWIIGLGVFLLVSVGLTIKEPILMLVVIPVVVLVVLGNLKFTKFCEGCGQRVQTNLPFTNPNICPRCGSKIS